MSDQSKGFFFNKPEFIGRKPGTTIISFPKKTSSPVINFTHTNNQLISVERSTFGGFIFSENTNRQHLVDTCNEFLQWAADNQITSITIRCFPDAYSPEEAELTTSILTEAGFKVLYRDITQLFIVDKVVPEMNTHRLRRLRSCWAQRFVFKRVPAGLLPQAYALFSESRVSKGYPITMSLQEFEEAFEKFPQDYILFGVFDKDKMIAACVSILIDPNILYCFFIGDALAYRKFSPVTQLVHGMYRYASEKNIKIVDLGISTDKGVLNEGLYSFKKSLGTIDSYKLTYQRTF